MFEQLLGSLIVIRRNTTDVNFINGIKNTKVGKQRFPNSFVGYGFVAAYLIAANWETRYGAFWVEVRENIKMFYDSYTGNEPYAEWFDYIEGYIENHLESYFRVAEDAICEMQTSDERTIWNTVASIKRSEIAAIETQQFYIQHLSEEWKIKSRKNDLLWYVYRFCTPVLFLRPSVGNSNKLEKSYYHIPLRERQFAIDLYDELMDLGIGDYGSGGYHFHKENDFLGTGLSSMEKRYGPGVYRDEISPVGEKYLARGMETVETDGCYIATCVYGTYDCPQVWVLRRFRDNILAHKWFGRAFIYIYYAISPLLVKWFGHHAWFKNFWKRRLDTLISVLSAKGVEDTPYEDKRW